MSSTLTAMVIFLALAVAVFVGRCIQRVLPQHHLSAETKDTIKLAMGLVATMAALVLGLLVSSAKGSYDITRSEVSQMAAKFITIEHALAAYGEDAAPTRNHIRSLLAEITREMWPEAAVPAQLVAASQTGESAYGYIQRLKPANDAQTYYKSTALAQAADIAQIRALLASQAVPSISSSMLAIVVVWLAVIFLSFSLLAPRNATAALALLVSAVSVSGAVLLILELDEPFGGFLSIPSQPMLNALHHLARGAL